MIRTHPFLPWVQAFFLSFLRSSGCLVELHPGPDLPSPFSRLATPTSPLTLGNTRAPFLSCLYWSSCPALIARLALLSFPPIQVAYCQGMNFLAGLLLMYMPTPSHAFAGLVVLMEERGLRRFYSHCLSLLQVGHHCDCQCRISVWLRVRVCGFGAARHFC